MAAEAGFSSRRRARSPKSTRARDADRCHPRVTSMPGSSSCCGGNAYARGLATRANQNPQQTRNGRSGEASPTQVVAGSGPRGMQSGAQRRQAHGVRRVGSSRPKKPNRRPTRAGRHCGDPSHRAAAQAGPGRQREVAESHSWPLATARLPDTTARHGRDQLRTPR